MKVIHKKLTKVLSIFSITALLAGSFPILSESARAADASQSGNLNFSVNVRQSLTVTMPDIDIALDVNPSSTDFISQSTNITVSTNNPTGYQLTMSAASTDLLRTPLADGTIPTLKTLDPLVGGYTEDAFTINRWGFKTGTGNYQSFTGLDAIASSATPVNEDVTNLTFATKVDYEQPAGTYELTLNFAVVGSPNIIYMQDVASNPSICTSEPTVVFDARDNKPYTIRSYGGKCWMTQNLAFNLESGMTLTSADTNVDSTVTLGTVGSLTNPDNATSYTEARIKAPDATDLATSGLTATENGYWYNYCAVTLGEICAAEGADTNVEATQSVCPAGWRLPTATEQQIWTGGVSGSWVSTVPSELAPVTSGYYDSGALQGLHDGSENGDWWSSSYKDSIARNDLLYSVANGLRASGSSRFYGLSARCVLK